MKKIGYKIFFLTGVHPRTENEPVKISPLFFISFILMSNNGHLPLIYRIKKVYHITRYLRNLLCEFPSYSA